MQNEIKNVVFVKKILADGNPCKKCDQVTQRLHDDELFDTIDQIVIAREGDAASEGMRLAAEYNVDRAPFFLVEYEDGTRDIFDIYLKFRKVAAKSSVQAEEKTEDLVDLIDQFPELDYI